MIDINQVTLFFGWCTVINMSIYLFSALVIIVFKRSTISLHSKLVGIDAAALPTLYFTYLGNYKIALLTFNLAPYMALKLMT